jgi:hypothetical protein
VSRGSCEIAFECESNPAAEDRRVIALNAQGDHFSFHQIPRDGFPVEVADTFGYFESR